MKKEKIESRKVDLYIDIMNLERLLQTKIKEFLELEGKTENK